MANLKKWKLLKPRSLIKNPWIEVLENDYLLPDNSILPKFYVIKEHDGVGIVAMTKEKKILIIKQYRPAVGEFIYSFPSGFIEKQDIDIINRARVELLEETGYGRGKWYYVGKTYNSPQRSTHINHCVVALNVKRIANQKLEAGEDIIYKLVTIDQIKQMIKLGTFASSASVANLYKALLFLEKSI